jgi:DNA repair exonuclease SbcCD ATPase subunit
MDSIKTNGITISKKGLSNDPDTIMKLYKEYVSAHKDNYSFNKEEYESIYGIIKSYLLKLHTKNADFDQARNVCWTVKVFKFDNLFGFGENNSVNFDNLNNIVGILGNNRLGKSSVIGGLMYVLYNTTDRGSLKNAHIINRLKNECYGMVRFSVAGVDYIVERKTVRSKRNFDDSNTTVNFWKIREENGQEIKVSINCDSGPDTDAAIRKVIGTAEDFLLTALASQGNLNRFIENKATKRKEILNRFLELDVFDYLFDFAKSDYSTLDNQSQRFSVKSLLKLIDSTRKEIESSQKELKITQEKIDSMNDKRDELNVWIKSHENMAAAVQISEFDKLKKEILDLEKNKSKLLTEKQSLEQKLKSEESTLNSNQNTLKEINIDQLRQDQKTMSEIEKNISEIKKTFELQNQKLKTNEKAIYKLTVVPCGDSFPECHFIKDGHEAKKTIDEQKSLVSKLSNDLIESKKIFDLYVVMDVSQKISIYNELTTKNTIISSNIERFKESIEHIEEKLTSTSKSIISLKEKLDLTQSSIDKLDSDDFKKNKAILFSIQKDLETLSQAKNNILIKLGGKQTSFDKLILEQKESENIIQRLKIFESIQSAFSKNGIPAMILKSQLPAINRELTKILNSLVDFNLTLETDTSSNVMDVYLDDGKSKRLIEMCSGMEKTICSLALRVALSNLSSLPKPDMLILDESFGALDEENLQKGIEFLTLLQGYFKCILVITHENPVKEIMDRVLEIKNDGIESKIEA